MKIVVTAGGTGGHIYPALAIIDEFKKQHKDLEVLYIGTHNRMEKDIVPKHGIPYKAITIYGFYRKELHKNFRSVNVLLKSYKDSKKILKEFKPDAVIGVGGYVTVPVLMAAKSLKIKTFIHEQNSVPGAANRFLSKKVNKIFISFESSRRYFKKEKTYLTGNPASTKALEAELADKKEFNLLKTKRLVYIVMGSLGSTSVFNTLVEAVKDFDKEDYEIAFVTGKNLYNKTKKEDFPKNVKIFPFVDNQARLLKHADLVVTRCGATTLSELIALKIPSILIPSPNVTANHQYKNGVDLASKKAAYMIKEKDLTKEILVKAIKDHMKNEKLLKQYKENLEFMHIENSSYNIYKLIKEEVS